MVKFRVRNFRKFLSALGDSSDANFTGAKRVISHALAYYFVIRCCAAHTQRNKSPISSARGLKTRRDSIVIITDFSDCAE